MSKYEYEYNTQRVPTIQYHKRIKKAGLYIFKNCGEEEGGGGEGLDPTLTLSSF